MYDLARRTLIGTISLMVLPILVWSIGWQWQPTVSGWWLNPLFWMTETVSAPWGILTSLVLSAWFLWLLRLPARQALVLLTILFTSVVAGQGIKSAMKNWTQEPRPFVVWLEQAHQVDDRYFYSLPVDERAGLLEQQLQQASSLPQWQRQHWQEQSDYAFPSGHAMFAVTWALLAVGLLWTRRHYMTVALIILWANSVIASRLLLGMHWPQDVAAAAVISAGVSLVAVWLAHRWCGPLRATGTPQKATVYRRPAHPDA
ncbi:phosphatidylglycerophosphatase B [Dickeya chrysanthemi]|uniref:undecaprenyl-diphosphate phosphatase n=1 Tax=Dickeya chrysanthemi TaxID=556 RepID=A0ABU8JL13_DICCH|nr:phosphatidylglycerophosphatase B [Dickeya chrysanthemi]MBX9444259.1 phosphatidylglycerophosphatase B [Dickeya chrysanthemi]MCA7005893.1 phosphatidylglycerophosphatase B [Dickeya chrysanthemi]